MIEIPTIRWDDGLFILDQTLLPAEEREIELATVDDVCDAIYRLAIRGAPAIGIAAAYGLVVAGRAAEKGGSHEEFVAHLHRERARIAQTRPTAVNLKWACGRMEDVIAAHDGDRAGLLVRLLEEARAIHEEDRLACAAMGRYAADLVRDGGTYLTHCNAGALATGGIGTALGVFHTAVADGKRIRVFADETRPLLQGARLTAWELARSGVEVVVICDSAAASVIAREGVEAVFVGADRIASNGDVANKLGTYSVALAARRQGIPFYVVAPSSTFDRSIASGEEIPIEVRPDEEITEGFGPRTAPEGVPALNLAFDVTPADLVTGIITEKGVILEPDRKKIAATLGSLSG